MRTAAVVASAALVAYALAYVVFRQTSIEIRERDGRPYVIFPPEAPALWLAFRPLTRADAALTGMGFHIGPHR